jgi:glycerophosphoryl diester phosphodiesterase
MQDSWVNGGKSERKVPAGRPRTVGHRGASALAPENTIRAFELAIQYGLDFAELDVHLSHDGEVMVIHDADLTRMAHRPVAVGDLSAGELGDLDVGEGLGVPRLVDVFAVARGRLGLYVEMKGDGTGAALGELVRRGAADGVDLIGGSFRPRLVAELRAVAPGVPRSVLFARCLVESMIGTCTDVGASYAHPCFRPVDAAMVAALHGAGLRVMAPHTNDAAEALEFARIGVDVIASDDPRILAELARGQKPA